MRSIGRSLSLSLPRTRARTVTHLTVTSPGEKDSRVLSCFEKITTASPPPRPTRPIAETERFHHTLRFLAPSAGTGLLTFRLLLKWGETQGGACFSLL